MNLTIRSGVLVLLSVLSVRAETVAFSLGTNLISAITFVSFDVETTGLSPKTERIIEYGAIKFTTEQTKEEKSWLINPRRRITAGAKKVHGITHDMVKRERIFRTVYPEIMAFIDGSVLLAHNARFDISFFTEEIKRNNKTLPETMVIDTLPLFRKWFPDAPAHNLTVLADYLGVSGGEFHRGMSDAAYVVNIFQIGMQRPEAPKTLDELIQQAGGSYFFKP
jgi:DNA polymerase III epsilon subunit family exonuclease